MVVPRLQPPKGAALVHTKLLDGELTIDIGDDEIAVACLQLFVDDSEVAVEDAGIGHRVARHPHVERCLAMSHDEFVEVYLLAHIVLGRRRESCPHTALCKWNGQLCVGVGLMEGQSNVVWFWFHKNLERPKGIELLNAREALNRDAVAIEL